MRVVVVGAGLAGLAATCSLADDRHEVILLERTRLLGGKATSFIVDGVEVDNGQHVHLGCCTDYLDFVDRLGLSTSLWTQPRFAVTVLSRGRPVGRLRSTSGLPGPFSLAPSFAAYRSLPVGAKIQIARALRMCTRPVSAHETFGSWLRRHGQGDDAIAGFWKVFVVPALNAGLEEASATDALFVIRTAFCQDPGSARVGWSRVPLAHLAAAAAERASELRQRTTVTSLLGAGGSIGGVRCANGATVAADAVVLAVPPQRVDAILGGDAASYGLHGLDRFRSRAIVDVHLWFDVPRVGLDFAAIVGSPVQWVFEKRPGYLCCSISAADDLVGLPQADLVELCRSELAAVWPRLSSARLLRAAVTRDPEATFVPVPGLVRPGPRTNRANLVIAGAWTDTGWPATMESAVRSGRAAAASLVATAAKAERQLETVHG